MKGCSDFIQLLGPDMSINILMCLEDPSDLVRASTVSSSWRTFVIANGFCKQLCLRTFPEISSVAHTIEVNNTIEPLEVTPYHSAVWACLQRDHKIYAFLARGLTSFLRKDCISEAITASSTDNYPEESIQNTLEPSDRIEHRASYWSSEGESDPAAAETLVYKLIANLFVITEIHVQPFQAYFQFGFPIYSAKAVRFRMGHYKNPTNVEANVKDEPTPPQGSTDEKIVWTYTSPEFPMAQESCLQKFMLPEPVLCVGGILQIELLGRVQRQEMDGLYYICISHVQVVGRPLLPAFDVELLDPSGRCALKYNPKAGCCGSPTKCDGGETSSPSRLRSFSASLRNWEQMILNTLLGGGAVVVDESDDEIL
ncbi:hypothetical protein RJ639_027971 [Escallonia herrerae]|uniref:F-box domain-containing protein n=1 Tax=Escallonia herrerae TaxID=1293975 RepID=A0AA88X3J9_9ASTE|nr:hypothetical protein RJ639_027971 [Escallonia herrerae]